jgi:kumamolisin
MRELDSSADARAQVAAFCAKHGIAIVSSGFRSFLTSGTVASYERAFATTISNFTHGDSEPFHRRTTVLAAPDAIAPFIRGIFGLDAWPHTIHRTSRAPASDSTDASLVAARTARAELAVQTLDRYNVARAWTGRGETIGILRYGGTFDEDDFAACLVAHGVSASMPEIMACDDASRIGHHVETFEGELALDVQVIATHAPGARIILYTTPHGERGFLDAIACALFDERRPATFSMSFGYPEHRWTHAALARLDELAAVAALLGVTLLAASGDAGAEIDEHGNAHVCAPASNRYILACGGTVVDTGGHESAWPHSGGGFAARGEAPPWQRDALNAYAAHRSEATRTSHGVPDVAAQVDPGYRMVYRGDATFTTGTSAVAPLWAALVARLNERLGNRAGFFAPLLYATSAATAPLHAILTGGNATYEAGPGWSPITGLGVPDGEALYERLSG